MRDGFTLCILLQIQAIEFEIDANFVIVFLTNYEASYAPIIDDYKNLMNWIPHWKFNHCYKEANSCTDTFAKMTVHLQQDFVILDTPPMELFPHLLYDLFGLGCNRLCYYGDIIVYSRNIINAYSLLSHKWWVSPFWWEAGIHIHGPPGVLNNFPLLWRYSFFYIYIYISLLPKKKKKN